MKTQTIFRWIARLVAALIMWQTLFFKFTASAESVYIFTQVGMEPWGRIGSGVAELIAALLILYPRTSEYGAAIGAGVMGGALLSHLTVLGFEIMGDGGQLFLYACLVLASCLYILYPSRHRWLGWLKKGRS
ncbi:MAG: DoxX family protein [Cyclobacteriaceae bacterium]|jgi:uncharacterized membrane protein YphA (DoxX/SURF4 family)|nr:DoxX family protein [Cyclobacteriaceae bacterium]